MAPQPSQPQQAKHNPSAIDVYKEFTAGEDNLRKKLSELSQDQLKTIISNEGLDPQRAYRNSPNKPKVIEQMIQRIEGRATHGDAFREESESSKARYDRLSKWGAGPAS